MQHHNVYIGAGALLTFSWLSLAFLDPRRGDEAAIGYFLGSLFAHATLAAAWTSLGPGPFIWRLPLAIAWLFSLIVAIAVNFKLHGGPSDVSLILGACLVGQWLLLQFPLGVLARGFGLQLRHVDEAARGPEGRQLRFGIRHLMIVMAIASVVLGIGRTIAPRISISNNESPIFAFLAGAAVVVTLPLLLAALMRQRVVEGIGISLGLIAAATAYELPLLSALGEAGPNTGHFIAINLASVILILIVAGTVRLSGYCLTTQGDSGKA